MFTGMEITFLPAGLPFIAIGALIVVSEVKARRNAVPAPGRVVGRIPPKAGSIVASGIACCLF